MKRIITISSIIIYLLFSQVWSIVHWHADEHHGELEIRLSVHPPDLPADDHDHEDHHDKSGEHDHNDTHFVGDWDFTFQAKTTSFKLAETLLVSINNLKSKSQVLNRTPKDIPLKCFRQYLHVAIPNRAPPQIA